MIVCLGWGSLIWDQKILKKTGDWFTDGPSVAIEFTRESADGRLTLVINKESVKLPVLWAEMNVATLDEAIESLRKREGTNSKYIGSWVSGNKSPSDISELSSWADSKGVSRVVWTALPPKFRNENDIAPSIQEAVNYLVELSADKKILAKQYVQKAPSQIKTKYRKVFEDTFGWYSLEDQ